MKRSTLFFAGLVSALALTAQPARAQEDAQELADRWTEAYNKHDGAALGSIYTDRARLMMHGSPTIAGRAKVQEFWIGDFKDGNPLTLLTVTHTVNGNNMLLVHGDYKVIGRDDGRRLGFGRFAHIWVRDGQRGWRLDRDLWNQPFEPYNAEANGATKNVQALADRWVQAYNRHDRNGLAALYTEDANLVTHGSPIVAGRGNIAAFWAEDFLAGNPLTLLTVTHVSEGLDMMLVHGNYEVVSRDGGSLSGLGRFAHIWTRESGGEWRLDRDLWQRRRP